MGIVMGLFSGNGIRGIRDEMVSFGSMYPCFLIATPIATINSISQGLSKGSHGIKNLASKTADNHFTKTISSIVGGGLRSLF